MRNKQFKIYDALQVKGKPTTGTGMYSTLILTDDELLMDDPLGRGYRVLDKSKPRIHSITARDQAIDLVVVNTEEWHDRSQSVWVAPHRVAKDYERVFKDIDEVTGGTLAGHCSIASDNLSIRRYDGIAEDYGEILRTYHESMDLLYSAQRESNVLIPNFIAPGPNVTSWAIDMKRTIDLLRNRFGNIKPIVPLLSIMYRDEDSSPFDQIFIDDERLRYMLDFCLEHCDGVILWNTQLDKNRLGVYWDDVRVRRSMACIDDWKYERADNIKLKNN